jgi:hypothetical protein
VRIRAVRVGTLPSECSVQYSWIMEKPQPLIERIAANKGPFEVKELATISRVSVRSVYNAIENDHLPVYRIGSVIRIDPVDAAAWLSARSGIR